MSPCHHVATISIPLHPSFRSHSQKNERALRGRYICKSTRITPQRARDAEFQSRTRAFSHFKESMSPCHHVATISIPPHPRFRSHSLQIDAHFVVGIDANLRASRQRVYNPRIYSHSTTRFRCVLETLPDPAICKWL